MFDKRKKFIYVLPQKRRHNLLSKSFGRHKFFIDSSFPVYRERQKGNKKNMNLLLANNNVFRSVCCSILQWGHVSFGYVGDKTPKTIDCLTLRNSFEEITNAIVNLSCFFVRLAPTWNTSELSCFLSRLEIYSKNV